MNKKTMAGTALGISLLGAASTAPISTGSFLGGLVHHGFLAASIGGLADWFAVTALFRKPLGISYRTEILTRNRQRIMQAVVDFAGNDLLNEDNIMQYVEQKNLSGMLVTYLESNERKNIMNNINVVISETLNSLDYEMLAKKIAPVISAQLQGKQAEILASNLTKEIPVDIVAREMLPLLADIVRKLLDNEDIEIIIKENLAQVLHDYEGNGAGRAFVMGLIGLDANSLWKVLREKAEDFLNNLDEGDSAIEFLSSQLTKIIQSESVNKTLTEYISKSAEPASIEKIIFEFLDKQLHQQSEHWQEYIGELAEEKLTEFSRNKEWQAIADRYIKEWLRGQLRSNHHVITGMIEERLAALSDEELVSFVEPKVSDDLQMIRINGSIVGGMAGMALFIITYLAGQVLAK